MSRHLTEQAVAEFRGKLRRVAARRFAEFGYAGVTLRAVAQELGCSRTTPYRYFKDKDHILLAVRLEGFRLLGQSQEEGGQLSQLQRDLGKAVEILLGAHTSIEDSLPG